MNLFFSWVSASMVLVLLFLYPIRKLVEKRRARPISTLTAAYQMLRKTHVAMGVLIIPVVYCHCRISARATGERSLFGVILLPLLLLLVATYFLRKPLGPYWKCLHQILAAILMIITVYHSFIEFV